MIIIRYGHRSHRINRVQIMQQLIGNVLFSFKFCLFRRIQLLVVCGRIDQGANALLGCIDLILHFQFFSKLNRNREKSSLGFRTQIILFKVQLSKLVSYKDSRGFIISIKSYREIKFLTRVLFGEESLPVERRTVSHHHRPMQLIGRMMALTQ